MNKHSPEIHEPTPFSRLYEMGQTFSAIFDLPELVRRVAEAALSLAEAEEALVVFSEPALAPFSLHARRAEDTPVVFSPFAPGEDASLPDPQRLERPLRLPEQPNGRSAETSTGEVVRPTLFVPIHKGEAAFAVIGVRRSPGGEPFSAQYEELLVGLGGYAAIAIENAQLYQQAVDRTMELSLLVESSSAVSSSLDLGSVLNAIARHMLRALSTHWCIISGWDGGQQALRRLAEHRLALWTADGGPVLKLKGDECYHPLLHSEQAFPVHLARSTGTSEIVACLDARGISRLLIVPLQSGGHLVGFAELASLHAEEPFTPAQIGHGMRLALELAPMLRGKDEPSRNDLTSAARRLNSATGANWTTLYAWKQGQHTARRLVSYGTGLWAEQAGPRLPVRNRPTLAVVLREQRIAVMRSTDSSLSSAEASLFSAVGPSAQLVLPLVFKGRTVGLVQLFDIDPAREFTSREMALAHTLAGQAAVALENAHLVRDLQRSLAEQKAMQSRLVHAARLSALGELSTVVAHQINNPLTTILGDAEMLVQDLPPDEPSHESAQAILRAGNRAKLVVERLLTMAHMDEEPRTQDVNQTIEETLQLVGAQLTRKRITLELHLDEDLEPVRAVPGQLEDVWMNLLINSRDAIVYAERDAGIIRIASRMVDDGKLVEVRITDNGCGVSNQQVRQIFDPFFTTKPRGEGTGLGLYICRQIIGEHGGEIVLESKPGEGTTVIVTLPTEAEAAL